MDLAQPAGSRPHTRKELFAVLWSLRPVRRTFVEMTLLTGMALLVSALLLLKAPPLSRWQTFSVWTMAPLLVLWFWGVPIGAGALAYVLSDARYQPRTCLAVLTSSLAAVAAYASWFWLTKGNVFFGWFFNMEHSKFSYSWLPFPFLVLGQMGCLGLALTAVLFKPIIFRVDKKHRTSLATAAGCGVFYVLNFIGKFAHGREQVPLLPLQLLFNLLFGLMLGYFLAKIGGECVIAYRERMPHGSAPGPEQLQQP